MTSDKPTSDVLKEVCKTALTVLCAAQASNNWPKAMMDDFRSAIAGLQAVIPALSSPTQDCARCADLEAALKGLIVDARPVNWDDPDDPEQAEAWRNADRALERKP